MTFFEKHVDKRSKISMQEFLSCHLRYDTMNSWNASTSYANCIKLHRLGLTKEQLDSAHEFINADDWWGEIKWPIDIFTEKYAGQYTIGGNGRSGGYLVLYNSVYKTSEHKSYCPVCGQRNFKIVTTVSSKCGVCGNARINYENPPIILSVYPGKNIDQGEDYSDWSMSELRDRVELVSEFDRTCDLIRESFIDLIDQCEVIEKTTMVPKTTRVISCSPAADC